MIKKHFFRAVILAVVALACSVCTSCEDTIGADDPISFIVYGTIVDRSTGNPVRAAEVSLHTSTYPSHVGSSTPNGSIGSAVTGMDGQYEMHCVITENLIREINNIYSLYIVRNGEGTSRKVTMTVSEGMRVQLDAAIY